MKRIALLALLLLIVGACAEPSETLPFYVDAAFTPVWAPPANEPLHTVRPFSLLDQDSTLVTERDLDGKIAVVSFFFVTCPDICPVTLKSLLALQETYQSDDDILLLSHSVTPRQDSVSALRHFAEEKGVDANRWKLLTGDAQQIFELGKHSYFLDDDLGEAARDTLFTHTENFVLLDRARHLRGIYNGMDPISMETLRHDIALLRAER